MKNLLRVLIVTISLSVIIISCKTENTTDISVDQQKKELIRHTVDSDGHPMAVWKKDVENPKGIILFVHGRTWSAVPDFDLQVEGEDLSLITIPTLIIQGELDPIAPTGQCRQKLFIRLKTADKSWVVISGGDYAAFMETPRKHFISTFEAFINRFNN